MGWRTRRTGVSQWKVPHSKAVATPASNTRVHVLANDQRQAMFQLRPLHFVCKRPQHLQ